MLAEEPAQHFVAEETPEWPVVGEPAAQPVTPAVGRRAAQANATMAPTATDSRVPLVGTSWMRKPGGSQSKAAGSSVGAVIVFSAFGSGQLR